MIYPGFKLIWSEPDNAEMVLYGSGFEIYASESTNPEDKKFLIVIGDEYGVILTNKQIKEMIVKVWAQTKEGCK